MKGRKKQAVQVDAVKKKSIWTNWRLYVMCLPAVVYLLLFNYKPMYGIIIAFKNYSMRKGIMGSPWIGFANFQRLFSSYWFPIILKNTLTLSLLSLVLGFPIPIILALALNEVQHSRFRKGFQTISYAPHFISTVVMCGMLTLYLSPSSGIINKFIEILGGDSKKFPAGPGHVQVGLCTERHLAGDGLGKYYLLRYVIRCGPVPAGSGRDRRSLQAAENLVCESAGIDADDSDPAGIKLWFPSERRL